MNTDNGVDYVSAPADYAELFERYYDYVVALVKRSGIDDVRKEDVAMEILLRFIERGSLEAFDPTLVFHFDGKDRPAKFRSYLTRFVLAYVRGHWDRQARLGARELLIWDMPMSEGAGWGDDAPSTWGELYGGSSPGPEDEVCDVLEEQERVKYLRDYIAGVPFRSRYDTCDLVALFDEVIRQIREQGGWNVAELRRTFGVSTTAMHTWMWWLRSNLAYALDRPVPAKRPRVLRNKHARFDQP